MKVGDSFCDLAKEVFHFFDRKANVDFVQELSQVEVVQVHDEVGIDTVSFACPHNLRNREDVAMLDFLHDLDFTDGCDSVSTQKFRISYQSWESLLGRLF